MIWSRRDLEIVNRASESEGGVQKKKEKKKKRVNCRLGLSGAKPLGYVLQRRNMLGTISLYTSKNDSHIKKLKMTLYSIK